MEVTCSDFIRLGVTVLFSSLNIEESAHKRLDGESFVNIDRPNLPP